MRIGFGVLAAAMACSLAGCMTAQQRMAEMDARMAAKDDASCQSYGARPGTDQYITCRTQLQASRNSAPNITVEAPAPAIQQPRVPVTCMRTGTMVTCS